MSKTSQSPHARFVAYDWETHISGPGTWLSSLLPELQARGIQCSVDVLYWDQPGPLEEKLRASGVECSSQKIKGNAAERVWGILNRASAVPVDVFVPNLVVPAFHAARWLRGCGIPTVGVLHSDDEFYAAILEVFAAGRQVDAVSHLVAVSRALEKKALASRCYHTSVSRIPYGVFSHPERQRADADSGLQVVYVGRLAEKQKRISDVTRAMLRIVSEVPCASAKLIGDGPEINVVRSILAASPHANRVDVVGRLDSSAVRGAIASADIILLLSDYEGLPIALLEGMSCGLVPVVSEMCSGVPELVCDGVNGLIVRDRSDAVVAAIRRLHADRDLLRDLSAVARRTIDENFTHDVCADQWASLIRGLAAAVGPGRREFRIPRSLDLPPVHPALACEDPRSSEPRMWGRLLSRAASAFSLVPGLKKFRI